MKPSRLVALALVAAFAFTNVDALRVASAEGGAGAEEFREEFHQTYKLTAGGHVALRNISGGARLSVWDRDEVRVDAVKHARTRERLAEATIEVEATGDSVSARTRYPTDELRWDGRDTLDNPASVEYTLTVPRRARVDSVELINGALDVEGVAGLIKATCVNGRLTARNLAGEARLSTINGALSAEFDRLEEGKTITLGSVNGTLDAVLPSDASAILKAETVHGTITSDLGLPVKRGQYVGASLEGQLGAGAARVKLSNVNGIIRVRRAADGRPQSPVTNLSSNEGRDAETREELRERVDRQVANATRRGRPDSEREGARVNREELDRIKEDARRRAEQPDRAFERELERLGRDAERVAREAQSAMQGAGREERAEETRRTDGYRLSEVEYRSFPVGTRPRISLSTFDGEISVEAWDRQTVSVTATKRARDERAMRGIVLAVAAGGSPDAVSFGAEFPRARRTAAVTWASVSLEVRVPRNANVTVRSGDGRLRLAGVSGALDLRTADGAIEVFDSRGTLNAVTGDGRVRVTAFEGDAIAETRDGRITLDGRFRQLAARARSGAITLALAPLAAGGSDFDSDESPTGTPNL
ncbi:MAG: DUF4097 domain-containing protein [Acidobacteria bacterium]|nr:DUF4097 domain-containing protein [Acidobacteriota bacterium]